MPTAIATTELQGVSLARQIGEADRQTQAHRGLTNRVLSGDAGPLPRATQARAAMAETAAQAGRHVADTRLFDADSLWRERRAASAALPRAATRDQRQEASAEHTNAVDSLRQMLMLVASAPCCFRLEASTLPSWTSRSRRAWCPLSETLGLTRPGRHDPGRGDANNTERVQILRPHGRAAHAEQRPAPQVRRARTLRHADPGRLEGRADAMDEFGSHVRSVFGADALEADAAAFFARASQTLGELQRVDREALICCRPAWNSATPR